MMEVLPRPKKCLLRIERIKLASAGRVKWMRLVAKAPTTEEKTPCGFHGAPFGARPTRRDGGKAPRVTAYFSVACQNSMKVDKLREG